jgi:branched chain amino acid efflux pump
MTATELLDPALVAIAVMAAATFVIRAGGFWLMGRVRLTTRGRRILEALPGSIVVAAVLPIATKSGTAAILAVSAAAATMIICRSALLGVVAGIAMAALAWSAGI